MELLKNGYLIRTDEVLTEPVKKKGVVFAIGDNFLFLFVSHEKACIARGAFGEHNLQVLD